MFLMKHMDHMIRRIYFEKEDLHIYITSKLVFHNPIVSIIIINFIIFKPISLICSAVGIK